MKLNYIFFKRVIDIIFAIIALIITSPIFIVVMPILKFTGENKIFYQQSRIGYKNKYFKIIKFTTMISDSEKLGTGSITVRKDPRVTKVGKVLRMTKINELPQFINLLKGDMTLVGPRPLMKVDFDKYPENIKSNIYNTKPGLTGIGSIVFRDEQAIVSNLDGDPQEIYKNIIMPYKGELETWYNHNFSFLIDLTIVLFTVLIIFFPIQNKIFKVFKSLSPKPAVLTEY